MQSVRRLPALTVLREGEAGHRRRMPLKGRHVCLAANLLQGDKKQKAIVCKEPNGYMRC